MSLITNFKNNFEYVSCYSMTSTGTTLQSATEIIGHLNVFTTVPVGSGVRLTRSLNLPSVTIINRGANSLFVYPEASSRIESGALGAPVTLSTGQTLVLNPGDPNNPAIFNTWYQQLSTATLGVNNIQWDTINGVSVPFLYNGVYDGQAWYLAHGGKIGSMAATPSQRAVNGTVLNTLFALALSQGVAVYLQNGTYEINNATGVVIPAGSAAVVHASPIAIISQFYNSGSGAPVLTIGDTTGTTPSFAFDIQGFWLQYGVAQTGLTNASALSINSIAHSRIGYIATSNGGFPPYNSVVFGGGPVFSCNIYDINCGQALQNQFLVNVDGTGNVFTNVYLNNGGTGTYNALGGSYINFQGGVTNEMTFIQLNCEWGACNILLNLQNMIGLRFIDLHVEGIKLTGAGPSLFFTANSAITVDTCDLVDLLVQTGNMTGTFAVIMDYTGQSSCVQINNFTWINNTNGQITAPVVLFSGTTVGLGNDLPVITIDKGFFRDSTGFTNVAFAQNVSFDSHMPATASQFLCPLRFGNYNYGAWGSVVDKAVIYPVDATYTHYGQYTNATLLVDASITSFSLNLGQFMSGTATTSPAQLIPLGTVVHVRRESGSASGTLTITNASGGAALVVNTTSAADYFFQVTSSLTTGSLWGKFNPVA